MDETGVVSMLTADALQTELMTRCLSGKAFTLVKELGRYQTQSVREDAGWQETVTDPPAMAQIQAAVSEVRQLAARFPQLHITYPQQLLSEQQPVGDENLRFALRRTNAVIEVPETFARFHGGCDFYALLQNEWQTQTDALTAAVCKRLRKREIRTAEMFGAQYDRTEIQLHICRTEVCTDIWQIALEDHGLYPLQWDSEICGMAQCLADALRAQLKEDCGETLRISLRREEQAEQCLLLITYQQQE